ncbi:MAG: 3-dehydroquinate synthase [bacterium]
MKIVELIAGTGKSKILIGEKVRNISKYIPENTIIIIDKNVNKFFGKYFEKYSVIVIEPGEQSKSIRTIEKICKQLLEYKADRSTFLLGIGGGVVTDITGFVASTFKRGLRFGYVSTTLLGQVDASIGGKNGINFGGLKNIIGTINQPEFIISDISTLKSLPKNEIINGLAEIIKTALIADKKLIDKIEENYQSIINLEANILQEIILSIAKIKTDIVQKDEKENGLRRILNFGHTFGHAIELTNGISHGEAISIGMLKALKMSVDILKLDFNIYNRVKNLLEKISLPVSVYYDIDKLENAIFSDKKVFTDKIKFVLLKDIGKPQIQDITLDELREYL